MNKNMRNKIIKISLVVIAVLIALTAWYWSQNTHSKEVLKLEILGPSSIEAGEDVNYIVKYKNNGNVRLENARLIFEYPENSIISEELRENEDDNIIIRSSQKVELILADIQPGEERSANFKGTVYGEENSTAISVAELEYTPRNLTASYKSETTHTTIISGVPFTFEVNLPTRVESGKEFTFDINYFSRIDRPLSDLRIKVSYPQGFEFKESRPKPSFESNEWEVGVLNKGQGGRIEVTGTIKGDVDQAKIIKAELGFWQDGRFIPLKSSSRGMQLAAPMIFITYQINGKSDYVASPGDYLYYEVFFKNTGEDFLENLFLTVKLNESVVDFNNVQAGSGNFQKSAGMILWDSTSVSQLKFLPTMEEGRVDFWVKLRDDIKSANPEVRVELSLGEVKERITTKIGSKVVLSQKGYFEKGPFDNYGPQPPKVGSSTSYTVHWQIQNYHNNLSDAKIRATLAPGVRLSGEFYPKESNISFDPISREVVWDIGSIPSAISSEEESLVEAFFQIIFDPQSSQIESVVEIVSDAKFSAKDEWTNSTISSEYRSIDTTLPDDPSVTEEKGIVE